jgi:energy-coupling factor transporter ATP-binding protein EcfA2
MRAAHAGAGLPHEKTNPAVARKIFYTLQSDHDTKEQALQHVKDEDTSWFGTGRDEQDDVVFQDFGRYARLMAEKSARYRRVRYPALVSFVGQTGAGKSSLIRLLIELYAPAGSKSQVPVVGSSLHQDVPTSGDVHLYADPTTFEGDLPILYADCEGLDGGERQPMGARARNKKGVSDKRTHSFIKQIRKQHHTSEREIVWATTPKTRSREYHVRNLYPRLLYTFSDVIVFVTKNPRVIENVIEQLIRWAAAALETSSNQPLLPHAIIVFNASDNATDPILWDVNHATISLMDSVRRAVHQNHNMRKFAEFWRQKGKPVESVEMLLLSYYSSIRVVRVVSIRLVWRLYVNLNLTLPSLKEAGRISSTDSYRNCIRKLQTHANVPGSPSTRCECY